MIKQKKRIKGITVIPDNEKRTIIYPIRFSPNENEKLNTLMETEGYNKKQKSLFIRNKIFTRTKS